MKKLINFESASRALSRTGLKLKKHSPEILAVAGVVGTVTSCVMACRATTKLSAILEESKEQVEQIHECVTDPKYSDKYSEEDSKKDLTIVYAQTGLKIVKLYAPSVILGALSITAMLTSNNILRKRSAAMAAAYAGLDKSFKEYRGRVVERFGEDLDRELKYNIKAKEVEETVVNEDGSETKIKKVVDVTDQLAYSDYAKFFDESCKGWDKDAELNLMFLRRQQDYANHRLQKKGFLFLNEVYELLGIDQTKAGQMVGWVYDPNNSKFHNYVDFGIYDVRSERTRAFVNGYERNILLDFNVDGNILDMI